MKMNERELWQMGIDTGKQIMIWRIIDYKCIIFNLNISDSFWRTETNNDMEIIDYKGKIFSSNISDSFWSKETIQRLLDGYFRDQYKKRYYSRIFEQ